MALSEAEIEHFARQIIVPGLGAGGQERLLSARVLVDGSPAGLACLTPYLEATGPRVVGPNEAARADCVVIAEVSSLSRTRLGEILAMGKPVLWYQIDGGRLLSGIHWPGGAQQRDRLLEASSQPPGSRSASRQTTAGRRGGSGDAGLAPFLHEIAACDAVASVVALLLGWPLPQDCSEVDLA